MRELKEGDLVVRIKEYYGRFSIYRLSMMEEYEDNYGVFFQLKLNGSDMGGDDSMSLDKMRLATYEDFRRAEFTDVGMEKAHLEGGRR